MGVRSGESMCVHGVVESCSGSISSAKVFSVINGMLTSCILLSVDAEWSEWRATASRACVRELTGFVGIRTNGGCGPSKRN